MSVVVVRDVPLLGAVVDGRAAMVAACGLCARGMGGVTGFDVPRVVEARTGRDSRTVNGAGGGALAAVSDFLNLNFTPHP
jgi:2,3-bisphosphoglycerate-independent phosphoglycerate mutase